MVGCTRACVCLCVHAYVCFERLLGHNQKEEKTGVCAKLKVDNMSAAWKPLGGEREIKKGIQAWHTCSDTSVSQRACGGGGWGAALWSEKCTITWLHGGKRWGCRWDVLERCTRRKWWKLCRPNRPYGHSLIARDAVFRLSKLNWRMLAMLNIAEPK